MHRSQKTATCSRAVALSHSIGTCLASSRFREVHNSKTSVDDTPRACQITTMTDSFATTVLQQIAATTPASFIHKTHSVRIVRTLYEQCISARLTAVKAQTDVEALEVVFEVALQNGLGCLVLDYVHEVCSSSNLVSSNPVDAALLDGATVERWCESALQKCKDRVLEQLNNMGLQRLKESSILQQESGCTNSLLLVVKALNQPGTPSG